MTLAHHVTREDLDAIVARHIHEPTAVEVTDQLAIVLAGIPLGSVNHDRLEGLAILVAHRIGRARG